MGHTSRQATETPSLRQDGTDTPYVVWDEGLNLLIAFVGGDT